MVKFSKQNLSPCKQVNARRMLVLLGVSGCPSITDLQYDRGEDTVERKVTKRPPLKKCWLLSGQRKKENSKAKACSGSPGESERVAVIVYSQVNTQCPQTEDSY